MLEQKIKLAMMDAETVADEIGDYVLNAVTASGKKGCVIGISGGVDSTATAALIKRAFDRYNSLNPSNSLELVGYILPSSVNNPADSEDGIKVAERLGIRYEVCSIEALVEAHRTTNPEVFSNIRAKGNMISRIRGNVLNTKSETECKTLAGTGNKDEDFGIGYYTLFGDGAVHISPIGNLPKRLVRQMARHLGFSDLADRIPTAGLEPGQTDFRDLGYSYDVVELVLTGHYQGIQREALASHSQIVPLVEKEGAQYESMFGKRKFHNAGEVVDDILRLHYESAIPKGRIVDTHPANVTLDYV